jgi:hypothetical protein
MNYCKNSVIVVMANTDSSIQARSLFFPGSRWMVGFCDLRWVQGAVGAVAILTPNPVRSFSTRQTHRLLCNRFPGTRPFHRWRWRDAVFEGAFGRSPDGSSLRSQAVTPHCGLTPRVSRNDLSTFSLTFPARLCRDRGDQLLHAGALAPWARDVTAVVFAQA